MIFQAMRNHLRSVGLFALAGTLAMCSIAEGYEPVTILSGGHRLQGTVCLPGGNGPFPAVIYHHGGAGRRVGGAPEDTCTALASAGFVGLAVIRRPTRPLTGHLDDADAAVDYAKQLPSVDPQRIGVIGFSRGGLLAWQQAVSRRDLAAVVIMAVAVNPELDLDDTARINAPVLILVAKNDTGSKYTRNRDTARFTRRLVSALRQAGRKVRSIVYPPFQPEGHTLFFRVRPEYFSDVVQFLKSNLKGNKGINQLSDSDLLVDSMGTDDAKISDTISSDVVPTRTIAECGVDTHQHLYRKEPFSFSDSAKDLISIMANVGFKSSLLMPPPFAYNRSYTFDDSSMNPNLLQITQTYPESFGLVGGGGILNPWIHDVVETNKTIDNTELMKFQVAAETILAKGAKAFGEMATLHLSAYSRHPFISIPANHPLYLRLAKVAADKGVPIDIHLEAVNRDVLKIPEDMRKHRGEKEGQNCFLTTAEGGNNPSQIPNNIEGFKELLHYNYDTADKLGKPENARIVWSHVGWDNTGDMTVDLLRTMLKAHPNLYLSLKMLKKPGACQVIKNRPLKRDGSIWPDWLALIKDYPGRFVLGGDVATSNPDRNTAANIAGTWALLNQLPQDIALQIACDNPKKIYNLN